MASKDMYFLPIIARAMEEADVREAFRQAFAEIKRLGQQAEYRRGFAQFQRFMEAAARYAQQGRSDGDSAVPGIVRELAVELVTDTFEGDEEEREAALDLVRSRPEWEEEYESICGEIREEPEQPTRIEVHVEEQGRLVGTIFLERVSGSGSIGKVTPGYYSVKLDTGRVIWEGELGAQDLVWSAAFPGRPLELAADTEAPVGVPTREVSLLGGELILRVLPGVENGRIEIEKIGAG